jgi:hypothetical protein
VTDRVQFVAVAASLLLLLVVFDLVRRRRLLEPYALPWLVAAIGLLLVSFRRDLLDSTATWLGVYYPPAVLLLLLTLVVFVVALWFSVVVSRQQRQVDRLIEEAAVLSGEIRELRKRNVETILPRESQSPAPNRPRA